MERVFAYFCTEWIWIGKGAVEQIGPEAKKLGAEKALIITDPGVHEAGISTTVKGVLEKAGIKTEIFSSVKPEPPFELANQCAEIGRREKVGLLVGLGGGSSMDIAKGASIVMTNGGSLADYFGIDRVSKPGMPTILIPTTSGTGSEVTRNAIYKDIKSKAKKAVVSQHILPRVAIIDPELMLKMPPRVTAFTGMDALTHSLESFMSKNANPISDMFALNGIRRVAENLVPAFQNGSNIESRENMALAALCGGVSLIAGGGGIAATSYPVEGHYDVPHGVGNTIMMPYVVRYNAAGNMHRIKRIAEQFGIDTNRLDEDIIVDRVINQITDLIRQLGLPSKLREVGMKETDIEMFAEEAYANKRLIDINPRELTLDSIKEIYREAL